MKAPNDFAKTTVLFKHDTAEFHVCLGDGQLAALTKPLNP